MNTLSLRLPSHTSQYPPGSSWAPSAGQKEKLHFSGLVLPRAPCPSFHIWALQCLCLWSVLCELCRHKKEDTAGFFISGTQRAERWDVGRREMKKKAAREWLSLYETSWGLLQMNPSTEEKNLPRGPGGFFKGKKSKSFFLKVKFWWLPRTSGNDTRNRKRIRQRERWAHSPKSPAQVDPFLLLRLGLPPSWASAFCLSVVLSLPYGVWTNSNSALQDAWCREKKKDANAHSRSAVTHRATMA